MTKPTNQDENWESRGGLALKFGATLSVLSVVAVIAAHVPRDMPDVSGASAPAAVTAPATNAPATADGKLYYFPSEYELHAPEQADEPAPTF